MNEDPIVAEIHRYRAEHAKKYNHDINLMCNALREAEAKSSSKIVYRKPQLLPSKIGIK